MRWWDDNKNINFLTHLRCPCMTMQLTDWRIQLKTSIPIRSSRTSFHLIPLTPRASIFPAILHHQCLNINQIKFKNFILRFIVVPYCCRCGWLTGTLEQSCIEEIPENERKELNWIIFMVIFITFFSPSSSWSPLENMLMNNFYYLRNIIMFGILRFPCCSWGIEATKCRVKVSATFDSLLGKRGLLWVPARDEFEKQHFTQTLPIVAFRSRSAEAGPISTEGHSHRSIIAGLFVYSKPEHYQIELALKTVINWQRTIAQSNYLRNYAFKINGSNYQ